MEPNKAQNSILHGFIICCQSLVCVLLFQWHQWVCATSCINSKNLFLCAVGGKKPFSAPDGATTSEPPLTNLLRGQQGGGSESQGSETALVTVRPANGIRAGGRKTSLVAHIAFKIHISFGLLLPLPLVKYCLPDKGSGCYPNLYCLLVLRKRFKFVRQLGWGISLNFSVSYLVKKKKKFW